MLVHEASPWMTATSSHAMYRSAMIHFDPRWSGPHGIGRFSDEILSRLGAVQPVHAGVRKLSALDPLATMLAVGRLRSGVYFTPGFNPPLRCPIPFVFCIHDLIHLLFAAESTLLRRAYYRWIVGPASRNAFRVLTVSRHAQSTILDWTGLPSERVDVVGNGVAAIFCPQGPSHNPGYPYFLFVGRREAHKNIARLLAGYASSRCRKDIRLLFTGPPDRVTEALARSYGLGREVVFSPIPSDADLAACYRGAVALAFPSLYEGFGLPIAEAMACGTPVLTSDATAMPETTGDGNAVLVDPMRIESIADGLDRIAVDSGLRLSLRERGVARARNFSWDKVAERVRGVLEAAEVGG